MYKKNLRFISAVIFTFFLFSTSAQVDAASVQSKRLWGKDRYQTCSEIVNEGWKTSEYAVVVNGENFPDALSASTLAKKYNAPILLTQDNTLDINTTYQLKRLDVKKVFIVGGNFVVKPAVENAIHKLGISTERFCGQDRTATSIAVAKQIGTSNGIILTTDNDFTDALSIAPIAAKLQMPIILMPKNSIPSSVSSFISGKNIPRTYILGESDLISDSIVTKFPKIERIPGKDKYERNINIINAFNDKFDFKNGYLAYSEKFADALSGSALAALNGNPIILIGDNVPKATKQFVSNKNFSNINILGGTAGINESNLNNLLGENITASMPSTGKSFPKDSDYVISDIKSEDVNGDGVKENIILTCENNKKDPLNNSKGRLYIQDAKTEDIIACKDFGEDLYIHYSKILLGDVDGDKIPDIIITSEYAGSSCAQACGIETLKNNKLVSLARCSGENRDFSIPKDSIEFSLEGWEKLNLKFPLFDKSYTVNLTNDKGMQSAKNRGDEVEPYIGHGPRFNLADIDKDGIFEVGTCFDISGSYHADCLVGFTNYYKFVNRSWKLVDFKIDETYPVTENIKNENKDKNSLNKITNNKQAYDLLISIAKPEDGFRFEALGLITTSNKNYIPSELRKKTVYSFMEVDNYVQISQYYITEDGSVYRDTVSRDSMCRKIN